MAEYKNGVNYRGNMSVYKDRASSDVHTGRAVFVDEDKYSDDAEYKAKVDKCLAEGFHRVGNSGGGGGGSSDFSTAKLTYSGIGQIYISRIYADGDNTSVTPIIADSGTYDVVLYNGVAYGDLNRVLGNVSVDGAIEYDDGGVIITGDCTITIS